MGSVTSKWPFSRARLVAAVPSHIWHVTFQIFAVTHFSAFWASTHFAAFAFSRSRPSPVKGSHVASAESRFAQQWHPRFKFTFTFSREWQELLMQMGGRQIKLACHEETWMQLETSLSNIRIYWYLPKLYTHDQNSIPSNLNLWIPG